MEIINVEKQTFESMLAKFEAFAKQVETMCVHSGDKSMQKWLDNQDVCQLLNISKRTLQTISGQWNITLLANRTQDILPS